MENINILIVEDKKSVAEHLERRLKVLEYTVCGVVPTGAQAVEKAAEMQPDIVLINVELEGEIDGIETAKQIRDSLDIPTIYLADYSNDVFSKKEDLLKRAEITNPFDYIPQPHGKRRLYLTIESTVYQHKKERETKAKEQQLSTILNSISDAVIATDDKELITFMNPAAEQLTGWRLEQAASLSIKQIFRIDNEGECPITAILRNMLAASTAGSPELSTDTVIKDSAVFTSRSGRKTHIDYSIAPSINQKGEVDGTVITFRDITDYKAMEERLNQTINQLQDQTQLMETIFDSMSDGVMAVDTDGRYLMVNTRAEEMIVPLSEDVLLADRPERYGLFHPDGKTLFSGDELPLTRALRGETTNNIEVLVSNDTQAKKIFVNINGRPLLDGQGNLKGGVVVFRDTTELKAAQTELEKTVSELRSKTQLMDIIFNSISDGVVVTDEAGNFLLVNPSAARIVGMGATDTAPDQWSDTYGTFYPDKVTPFPNEELPLIQAMQGRVTDEVDLFIRNPENPEGCFINVTGRPLQDERNKVRGGVIVFRDVTKTKSTEARLEQTIGNLARQTQLMDTVFNSMNDGVLVLDTMGQVLFTNSSVELACIDSPRDVDSSKWTETYGVFYLDKETPVPTDQMPVMRALRGEKIEEEEFFIRNIHNNTRNKFRTDGLFVATSASPLLDKDRQIIGSVAIVRDITQQKTATMQLEQTMQELQNQTQLMDIIFNNMSDGVVVADNKGQYIMSNPAAQQIIGQNLEELDLPRASEQYGVFHPTTGSLFPSDQLPLALAIKGESPDNIEMHVRNPQGSQEVYVSVNGRPLLDEKGISRGGVVVARDITEIKRTQIQLENQTQLLETVFNSMSDGVLVADENGEYIMANPAAEKMIGGQRFDELNLPQSSEQYGLFDPTTKSLFPPDQLPLTRAVKGESTDNIEMHVRNPQLSQEVYVSVNGRPLLDERGVPRGGVVVAHNITELKQTQSQLEQTVAELENQSQLLEVVFNNMSDGVVVADDNGRYVMYNQTAEQMTGQQLEPMAIKDAPKHFGFFFPDQKTTFPADQLPLARALHGEESDNVNLFMHNPRMQEGLHLSISARPLRDAQGVVTGGVSVSRDVTKLRQAETDLKSMVSQLEEQGNLMESIFNSISDGVVVADENGAFTIFNPSAEKIIGLGAVDTTPDHWSDDYGLFFPDRVTPFPSEELPLTLALKGEASDEVEMFVRNPKVPDGVFISASGRPLYDEAGTDKGGVVVFRDVTHRVIAEEALTQAFAQGRLEIVETILHNIGNAINSVTIGVNVLQENIVGNQLIHRFSALADMVKVHQEDWVDYIKNDPKGQQVLPFMIALATDFTDQNKKMVETLERVGERVTHIIDIIRTQRSSNQSSMTRKNIDLQEAILSAVKLQQDSIGKRGIQVDVECGNVPQEIQVQESQFQQMLVNLLKNSIEAIDDLIQSGGLNETPRIEIKTYINEDFLCLDVIDNGIGIAQKDLKLIFNAGYTTKQSGTGLGLHSSANFIIGSGGRIYPLSKGIGKGTTMRIMMRCSSVMP